MEFKLTQDELAAIIDKARNDFHNNGPAKSLAEVWSRKAALEILELVRKRLVAAQSTCG